MLCIIESYRFGEEKINLKKCAVENFSRGKFEISQTILYLFPITKSIKKVSFGIINVYKYSVKTIFKTMKISTPKILYISEHGSSFHI